MDKTDEPSVVAPSNIHRLTTNPLPNETPPSYEWRLIFDLERLLRYSTTAKDIDVAPQVLTAATKALQDAQAQMQTGKSLTSEAHLALLQSIDDLSPKVYPVTTASLEIADVMEAGNSNLSPRQAQIKKRVEFLTTFWMWTAVVALLAVFILTAFNAHGEDKAARLPGSLGSISVHSFAVFMDPIVLGFLGACAYILRTVLTSLANKTFVLRDGTTYTLRAILGMILGFIIPNLFPEPAGTFHYLSDVAVPFLAGYAVEPMFAALDTIVTTIRDAVSRSPTGGVARAK
jgi:hypothetical protein